MRSDFQNIIGLYQEIVTVDLLQFLQKQGGMKVRRGIYGARVVLWLMMLQRLHRGATLAMTVQLLIQGAAKPLLQRCHRVEERKISSCTGGYCQARQKLPKLLCRQVNEEIVERLRQYLGSSEPGPSDVFVLDGSSLELEHCRELLRCYPAAQNQYGKSHWPVVKIVVAHDVNTAMAQTPCWGAMYGDSAVSEQQLAERVMDRLPAGSTVMGDRNFGVFWVACVAQQRNLNVVLRLTEQRAKKLAGMVAQPGAYPVVWKASQWEGRKRRHPFEADAAIEGRIIAARIGRGKSKQWLYLFTTTANLSVEEVVALYKRRWNIETDLRSLKHTVNLRHIYAKSQDVFEKELLMAISAYNFVRAVMCLAARRNSIDPRQLSFTGVLNVVNCAWSNLIDAPTKSTHDQEFIRVLELSAQCKLPIRRKRRSFRRTVWRHGDQFPARRPEKTK